MTFLDIPDDSEMADLLAAESARQEATLTLVPAENYLSAAVRAMLGGPLSDRDLRGLVYQRWHGGTEVVDQIELLAIERAKQAFGVAHAVVQPLSPVVATLAVLLGTLAPGDCFLAPGPESGIELAPGLPLATTGASFAGAFYELDPATDLLDYDALAAAATVVRPRLIVGHATFAPRAEDLARLRAIADGVGARLLIDLGNSAGLVVAGVLPDPCAIADIVTAATSGTLRGPGGALILTNDGALAEAISAALVPGLQAGPFGHHLAAQAVALDEARRPEVRDYAEQVVANTYALASSLEAQGVRLIASGGDGQLLLIDLTTIGPSGTEAVALLDSLGLVTARRRIPRDPRPAGEASGLAISAAAATTRRLGRSEMALLGELIARPLHERDEPATLVEVRGIVAELCRRFPLPDSTTAI